MRKIAYLAILVYLLGAGIQWAFGENGDEAKANSIITHATKNSKNVAVVCLYEETIDRTKAPSFSYTISCTVVKSLKGQLKFGQKLKIFKVTEDKEFTFGLGSLRYVFCDDDYIEGIISGVGEFEMYSEEMTKMIQEADASKSKR